MEELRMTKKELLEFLSQRRNDFINYESNPFVEARVVTYITNGLSKIVDYADDTKLIAYDDNGILCIREDK